MIDEKKQEIDLVQFFKVFSKRRKLWLFSLIIIEIVFLAIYIIANINRYNHTVTFSKVPYDPDYKEFYDNYLDEASVIFKKEFGVNLSYDLRQLNDDVNSIGKVTFSFNTTRQEPSDFLDRLQIITERVSFIKGLKYAMADLDRVQEQLMEITLQMYNLEYLNEQFQDMSGTQELPVYPIQSEIKEETDIISGNMNFLYYLAALSASQRKVYISRLTNIFLDQMNYSLAQQETDLSIIEYMSSALSDYSLQSAEILSNIEAFNPYYAQVIRNDLTVSILNYQLSTVEQLSVKRFIKWALILTAAALVLSVTLIFAVELIAIARGMWKSVQES